MLLKIIVSFVLTRPCGNYKSIEWFSFECKKISVLFFIETIFITIFALRAKSAHLKGLCCLQCITPVTNEQNIHK